MLKQGAATIMAKKIVSRLNFIVAELIILVTGVIRSMVVEMERYGQKIYLINLRYFVDPVVQNLQLIRI